MTTLNLRAVPPGRVDMTGVLPETMAGRTANDIAAQVVRVNGNPVALGDLFDVTRDDDDVLAIHTHSDRLDFLGRGMGSGTLHVEGPAGHYVGQDVHGGEISIRGDVGDCAANGMTGGVLRVYGNAGDWLGAALIGDRTGMSGGVVVVEGDVGDRLGDRMRRGLIMIRGKAGDACGARLMAGTIVVAGGCGDQPGFGLRRGSLILGQAPALIPDTFTNSGLVDLTYLGLLHRYADGIQSGIVPAATSARRYMGDQAFGGKGEILVLT